MRIHALACIIIIMFNACGSVSLLAMSQLIYSSFSYFQTANSICILVLFVTHVVVVVFQCTDS